MTVQSRSDGVNTSLFEKREHIEKLHRTRNLLRKVQVHRNHRFLHGHIYADENMIVVAFEKFLN